MSDPYDNWLADAVDAARECAREDAPSAREGAATRARIHASLEARRGTNKRRLTLISAVIASLFGSTAFAYYSGWRPFTHAAAVEPAPVADSSAPSPKTDRRNRIQTPTPDPMPAPVAESPAPIAESPTPRPTPIAESPTPKSRPTPTVTPPLRSRVTPPEPPPATDVAIAQPPPEAPPPVPDAELAAYQEAHAAHFRGTDAAAALAAWDRYLARFPNGQLAPEARYDRAIVLVKLSRWAEARAALTPFASAPAGTYRQREAAKILDAIRGR